MEKSLTIKGLKWGYTGGGFACGPVEGAYVVEVEFLDETGCPVYIGMSELMGFQELGISKETLFQYMMDVESYDPDVFEEKCLYSFATEERNIFTDVNDSILEQAIRFVCFAMEKCEPVIVDGSAELFIEGFSGINVSDETLQKEVDELLNKEETIDLW